VPQRCWTLGHGTSVAKADTETSSNRPNDVYATYGVHNDSLLDLCSSPPYSPELYPDEFVWHDVKNNAFGRRVICDEADIGRAGRCRLRLVQRNPEKVRSFFRAGSTAYAAE